MKMKIKYYGDSKNNKIVDMSEVDFQRAYEGRYFTIYSYEYDDLDKYEVTKEPKIFYGSDGRTFTCYGWSKPDYIYETWKVSDGRFLTIKMSLWEDINKIGVDEIRDQFSQHNECELLYLSSIRIPKWFCQTYID